MNQHSLDLDTGRPGLGDPCHDAGFALGCDHARHGLAPPPE